ncbi:MAG TPA: thiamine diphosphokinase [Kiritimatiellia bacterium]|nr:thiamine diphosphokinase [Kiritimatiellia bacterium]HRU71295.1 thiamine diphosphokinase [Kiritimatiellia bacterium]
MNPPLSKCVIVANGAFPAHPLPLAALRSARRVVCCDGAVEKLEAAGFAPDWIVGDLDSLSDASRVRHRDRLVAVTEQESNDLAKAFRFCVEQGWRDVVIVGATGLREDHTLGNLAWLVDFAQMLHALGVGRGGGRVVLLTDTGIFTPALASTQFRSHAGQQVSIFSFESGVKIYAEGLKYPLGNVPFTRWWQATLNESLGEAFKLVFEGGPLLVFQTY